MADVESPNALSRDLFDALAPPAVYTPFASGKYSVAPGLFRLGTEFGNGDADEKTFQIDRNWARWRESKLQSRTERPDKYIRYDDFDDRTRRSVARLMAQQMANDNPDLFTLTMRNEGVGELFCRLTGETLLFDNSVRLVAPLERYTDAFDALCCQVQEDVAVLRRNDTRGEWLTALHICHPSRWSPQEKIGKSFAQVHIPVPGMQRTISASASLMEMMIHGQPYVRFMWGIEPTDRLNHHPDAPPSFALAEWNRRGINPDADPPFWVRVERQVMHGLPGANAFMFTIRLSFLRGDAIRADDAKRTALRSALAGMDKAEQRYKGLEQAIPALLAYLDESTSPGIDGVSANSPVA